MMPEVLEEAQCGILVWNVWINWTC